MSAASWKKVILRTGDGLYTFENVPAEWKQIVRPLRDRERQFRVFGQDGHEFSRPPFVPTRTYRFDGQTWDIDSRIEIWDEVVARAALDAQPSAGEKTNV